MPELEVPVSYEQWRTARVVIEYSAATAGALSGCLHAIRRGFDPVGTFVIAIVSGLGGGMFRDVLLGDGPVLALQHPMLLVAALGACVFGVSLRTRARVMQPVLWLVDALSIGLFTVAGIQRGEEARLGAPSALFLGVLTGTGGGLIRDVLCHEVPRVLVPGVPYATASLLGGLVYFSSSRGLGLNRVLCEWLAILACFALRAIGTRRRWIIPEANVVFRRRQRKGSERRSMD
ncbi:MAG TPA: TRIC cation channel family protein [Polyangiaceae bacterium]